MVFLFMERCQLCIYFCYNRIEISGWQASQASIAVGSQVWAEDPNLAWIVGEVLEVNGDEIKIRCSSKETFEEPTEQTVSASNQGSLVSHS